MIRRNVTLPEIGLVAGTRAALGVGIGLLLADRLSYSQRRAAGWTLLGVGVMTTFPLLAQIAFADAPAQRGKNRRPAREPEPAPRQ